jgi:membrane protease subunit (stomatin/prohibitin family)
MAVAEVIKYEGDNSTFIWKHPCEDFNTTTQLIVHESQEAIFFMNGQALDLFGPGRYTLETQNIPLLKKFTNIPTDGKTPFQCEVYFINKTEQMAIKWGTDSRVQYIEPTYRFPLSIGASGEMSLSVSDSRKLLINLVGTERVLERNQLTDFFRAFLMTKVKTYIAQEMRSSAINIFEIDEQLESFSTAIKAKLDDDFLDYGVNLKRFFVTAIVKPDGDPQYEKFKELHFRQYADIAEAKLRQQTDVIYAQTEAQKVVIDSQAQATKRAQEGYTYQQERGFNVAQDVARNEAVGQFTNMGVGLGTMAGVGGAVGGVVGGAINGAFAGINNSIPSQLATLFCDQCGAELTPGATFCDNCGALQSSPDTCSKCGFKFIKPGKFCSKCGAKREG